VNIEETKNAIAVMQAFVDGKPVQYRPIPGCMEWGPPVYSPLWDWKSCEYRVKPETVQYRRYLAKISGNTVVGICVCPLQSPERTEQFSTFIRWIDKQWIEEEV
jgi:hypothetical protein